MINLNNKDSYGIKEVKIFNNGEAGLVHNVTLTAVRKESTAPDNYPDWRLIAHDDKGQINEGFYYYNKEEDKGFKEYQVKKLIFLIEGVFGKEYETPEFPTPTAALDTVMSLVAKEAVGKKYNVMATYGTKTRPNNFIKFKVFGKFVEAATEKTSLRLENSDLMIRPEQFMDSKEAVKDLAEPTTEKEPWEV